MYKVKIVLNGVLREMTINGNNAIEVQQIITNMYSGVGRSRNNRYKESVKMKKLICKWNNGVRKEIEVNCKSAMIIAKTDIKLWCKENNFKIPEFEIE